MDDPEHRTVFCPKPCARLHHPCEHHCRKECGQPCGPCMEAIPAVALPCGHTAINEPCFRCRSCTSACTDCDGYSIRCSRWMESKQRMLAVEMTRLLDIRLALVPALILGCDIQCAWPPSDSFPDHRLLDSRSAQHPDSMSCMEMVEVTLPHCGHVVSCHCFEQHKIEVGLPQNPILVKC